MSERITAQIRTHTGMVDVEGRTTVTPGLVVTRAVQQDPLTDTWLTRREWRVTHAQSGYCLTAEPFQSLKDALFCAALLKDVADWTVDHETLKESTAGLAREVNEAMVKARNGRFARDVARMRKTL
jgi:hypothetical protein